MTTETNFKPPVTAQEVQETLQDGTQLQVRLDSPGVEPEPQWVKVRRCPRGEFVAYAGSIIGNNEIEEAAFYISKPVEFVNALSDDSFEAVMQEGRRLNFTRFESWFARKQQLLRVTKTTSREIQMLAEKVAEKLAQKN